MAILNEGLTITVQVLVINIEPIRVEYELMVWQSSIKQVNAHFRRANLYRRAGAPPARIPPPNTSHETRLSVGIINALLPMPYKASEIDYTHNMKKLLTVTLIIKYNYCVYKMAGCFMP